jgi:hypothetical protein
MNEGLLLVLAFVGAFAGSLLADLVPDYVIRPLHNRARHRHLLDRATFKAQWGGNVLAFFVRHNGFTRGGRHHA